jgi:acyl-CoA synthetase (AMP-forming)/AMP-acid ligase II
MSGDGRREAGGGRRTGQPGNGKRETRNDRVRVRRLLSALRARSDSEALVYGGRSYSFGELDGLSAGYATRLESLGIRAGDRIAVFAESSAEVVVALLGHYRMGVIHVPINTRYLAEEAGHILRDSGARAVLFDPASPQAKVLDEIRDVPALEHRIPLADVFSSCASRLPPPACPLPSDSDTALIVYTSGTTGKSKGAALSFAALVDNIDALTTMWGFSVDDRLVLCLPLFHVHGLCIGVHGALLHGMTLLLLRRFDPAAVVEAFSRRGATVFMGVPTMYVRLLEHLEKTSDAAAALAGARLFTSGSAALPAADFEAFERRTGHRILERYGMTETLFTLSNPYAGERRPGTVGLPVAGCEVRLVDEQGRDATPGEAGEILVRGSGIMSGYWGRPEDTKAAFRDGWFATGDVARRDSDGYVRILGRQSVDIIKSGGFKISAREIEDVIAAHPAVREVAVLGVPDRVWGERIVAAVALREDTNPSAFESEVADLCRLSLADYKQPREVRVVADLPRNALGKVQKHRIREELAGPTESPSRRADS